MKRLLILLLLAVFLLTGCATVSPDAPTDSTAATDATQETAPPTGWITEAAHTFYVNQDGSRHTGWLELNNTRYY